MYIMTISYAIHPLRRSSQVTRVRPILCGAVLRHPHILRFPLFLTESFGRVIKADKLHPGPRRIFFPQSLASVCLPEHTVDPFRPAVGFPLFRIFRGSECRMAFQPLKEEGPCFLSFAPAKSDGYQPCPHVIFFILFNGLLRIHVSVPMLSLPLPMQVCSIPSCHRYAEIP